MSIQREEMRYDVVIVGAGPAGLSAAIKIKITMNFVNYGIRWSGGAIAIGILYFFDIFCEIFANLIIFSPEISS